MLNASAIGFGIKGANPDQAQQVNHNEGFSATLDEASDNVTFGIQNIGNNAKSVDIYYQVGTDADGNGIFTGSEITGDGYLDNVELKIGSEMTQVEIAGEGNFQTAQFAFFFEKNNVTNPSTKNWQSTAGVRIVDFAVEQDDTIPEYDFLFGVTRSDDETAADVAGTTISVHVDPDLADAPMNVASSSLSSGSIL